MEQGINAKAAEIANESAENAAETKRYVIALDQGTTSSRAMLVDRQGHIAGACSASFRRSTRILAGSNMIQPTSSPRNSEY